VIATGTLNTRADISSGQALLLMPGVDEIAKANLGVVANQSGTIGGYRFTVQRAYMDANRFVLSFRVAGPTGRPFFGEFYTNPVVSVGAQVLPRDEGMGSAIENSAQDLYYAYDSNTLANLVPGSVVPVHIVVPSIKILERVSSSPPAAVAGEMYRDLGHGVREVTVQGTLSFDVKVPVDPRVKTINVNQEVTSKPSITLDRIIVTPTYARIFYRGGDPDSMFMSLAVNGQNSKYFVGPWRDDASGEVEFGLNAALFGQKGKLSIVVYPSGRYASGATHGSPPVEVPLT
jgi:hypothetical protein